MQFPSGLHQSRHACNIDLIELFGRSPPDGPGTVHHGGSPLKQSPQAVRVGEAAANPTDPGIITAGLRLWDSAAVQCTNLPPGGNQLPPQGGSDKSGGPGEGQRAGHTTRQRSTPVASGENSDDRDDRFMLRAM
jgi:hypothetical protein